MPPFHPSPLSWQLTCAHHTCKHPALAILNRSVVVLAPFLEDHHAAIPPGWVLMRVETSLPLPQENSIIVIISIDLKRGQWTECTKWSVCSALSLAHSVVLAESQWCFLLTPVRLGLSCPFLTIELITRPTYLGSPLRDTSMAGSWR